VQTPTGATVTLTGTPTQKTCSGDCEMSFVVKAECGSAVIKQKYTYKCPAIRKLGETGNKVFYLGQAVNYCMIVDGETPIEMMEFQDLPYGFTVSVSPHSVVGQTRVCIIGTVALDPCAEVLDGKICSVGTVVVSNQCGEKTLEFPTTFYNRLPP
jgi:hypothetical protein